MRTSARRTVEEVWAPHYFAAEVKAQMRAGFDNGIHGWMLWNPRSDYNYDALRPDSTSK